MVRIFLLLPPRLTLVYENTCVNREALVKGPTLITTYYFYLYYIYLIQYLLWVSKGLFQLHYGWTLQHKNVKNAGLSRTVQTETMYVGQDTLHSLGQQQGLLSSPSSSSLYATSRDGVALW